MKLIQGILTITVSAGLAVGLSCAGRTHPRPEGVPPDAVWAGGVDGGNWITCTANAKDDFNQCTVYHDYTGEVRLSAEFVLEAEVRAATQAELVFSYADVGHKTIILEGGKKLVLRHPVGR